MAIARARQRGASEVGQETVQAAVAAVAVVRVVASQVRANQQTEGIEAAGVKHHTISNAKKSKHNSTPISTSRRSRRGKRITRTRTIEAAVEREAGDSAPVGGRRQPCHHNRHQLQRRRRRQVFPRLAGTPGQRLRPGVAARLQQPVVMGHGSQVVVAVVPAVAVAVAAVPEHHAQREGEGMATPGTKSQEMMT